MYKISIKGTVQGVGFRPYIYRKAKERGLTGYVKNIGGGVEIVVDDKEFINFLDDLPPLARITGYLISKEKEDKKYDDFSILKSTRSSEETELPPDIFMCKDCLRELRDHFNRRHEYYFITCTNCGPRFSMIEDYPYDRPLTSMKDFEMCPSCRKEYTDPMDRRYHAQTIACRECGPKLKLFKGKEDITSGSDIDTIRKACGLMLAGDVISIKGVGGFHICSLASESSVKKIRNMLRRADKPFAIMVRDIVMLKSIAHVSSYEQGLLESPKRPIVVLRKKARDILPHVSELDSIGVMFPYTALHYLLFDFINQPLVMTSCNLPGEPVSLTENLGRYFLTHERRIVNRCDDSVIKVIDETQSFLRRSRGYVPLPVKLGISCKDTLALGAELNNVVCAAKKDKCFLSQYVGDTSRYETAKFMGDAALMLTRLTRLKPKIVACDLHPNYSSTLLAKELARKHDARLVQVQHHKAHVASVAAEHGITDYVGIAMDGMGYGEDGKVWGGEVFEVKDRARFKRIGHLEEQPQLGGDSAAIYPKKMLFGILSRIIGDDELLGMKIFSENEASLYLKILEGGFNTPMTSSAGRILDSVSALLGICDFRSYDGRPAMLLESEATRALKLKHRYSEEDGRKILLTSSLFRFLLENLEKDKGVLAATAQMYIADGLYKIAKQSAGDKPIVFSGGVAYNRMISGFLIDKGVLVNKEVPCGDGGICFGQAYLANVRKE